MYIHNYLPSTAYSPWFRQVHCFHFVLIQYLCLNFACQCSLPERMCALPWNYREILTCPQGRSQNLVQLYLIGCELRPLPLPQSLFLTAWQPVVCIGLGSGVLADALIAFSMCWYLYRKRTGFSRHVHFLLRLYSKFVNFVFRTDSMIMTLMSYSINSGLLTWWDIERRRSHTRTNPSSILTTGVLIAVRSFPHISTLLLCLML